MERKKELVQYQKKLFELRRNVTFATGKKTTKVMKYKMMLIGLLSGLNQLCFFQDCSGLRNEMECPHDLDACLNEVRYHNGIKSVHKLCAQWRPKLGKQVQGNTDITKACTGRQQ